MERSHGPEPGQPARLAASVESVALNRAYHHTRTRQPRAQRIRSPLIPVPLVERDPMTFQNPRAAFRRTQEDDANLIEVHSALREPHKPIATASASIRAALRVAGLLARRGQLRVALAEYRAELAGETQHGTDRVASRDAP